MMDYVKEGSVTENQAMKPFEIALLVPYFNQRSALEASLGTIRFHGSMLVVIVDDGSPQEARLDQQWIETISKSINVPLHVLRRNVNGGIEYALNDGLKFILHETECKYIARLDCGDLNMPERFERQYGVMESDERLTLVGTWATISEGSRVRYVLRPPASHQRIKTRMLSGNCFVHPSVMFRATAVRKVGYYPLNYPAAEDYAYFFSFVRNHQTANIPEVLLSKSYSKHSLSFERRRRQLRSRLKVILHNFRLHPCALWGLFRTSLFLVVPTGVVEAAKEIIYHDSPARH